jgi:hypothetical protein
LIDRWNKPTPKGLKAKVKIITTDVKPGDLVSATSVHKKKADVVLPEAEPAALEPKTGKRKK